MDEENKTVEELAWETEQAELWLHYGHINNDS